MNRGSGSVERVLKFLERLAVEEGPIQVSTMAEALQLPPSTVHRLIGKFVEQGLLRRTTGSRHYEIGLEAFRLGAALSRRLNMVELAMPSLQRIMQASGESCALGLYRESDFSMFFAAHVDSPEALRYHVELYKPEPVFWGASGRAILAYVSAPMSIAALESHPVSPTGVLAPGPAELEEQLASIRRLGYSTSTRGERVRDACGIAVPLFSSPDRVIGCLALTIPRFRYREKNERKLALLMKSEGYKLSATLSGIGTPKAQRKTMRSIG